MDGQLRALAARRGMAGIATAMSLDSVATTGSSMSSGQTSGNNKTWLARHLKTLFLTITPPGTTGHMAPVMGTITPMPMPMPMPMPLTLTLTRRLPRAAAAAARPPSR
ncbi:protein of unknown function (plasmid) [Cupriavidus taiwanensis]|uniref:Uncharacterized protein n=1 Tax=Cupriavidus taiwanensis TaxID=164546 RepID=A0A7Z7JCS3_9BURK|nr:protein of unknown function [Cupriavidus taiwanensis]SOZ41487.1 protein of unknown function [Cupriavidus taiwanensis]SPC20900.1 protein of unknown function [Cupriavidus taiwanensis]SPD55042.1 protein of unknown function [Cupriavidus taiwanensis]